MSEQLDGGAIAKIERLVRETNKPHEIGGYTYAAAPMLRVNTDPKQPDALTFTRLAGFAGYIKTELYPLETMVHVSSPFEVRAIGHRFGADRHLRNAYAVASHKPGSLQGFAFNTSAHMEVLAIALQTCFEPGQGDVEELRKFCASVRSTEEVGIADDGVSQEVKAKSGIAAVVDTPVRNPWWLAPWRTFPEVKQPLSPYVLRFNKSDGTPRAGLFETGNARWEPEAVAVIVAWLKAALGDGWNVLG